MIYTVLIITTSLLKSFFLRNLLSTTNGVSPRMTLVKNTSALFVTDYFTDRITQRFRIFFTTIRLLKFELLALNLISDATYKILIEGFIILTIGTSDKNGRFHPFGYAISKTERDDALRGFLMPSKRE